MKHPNPKRTVARNASLHDVRCLAVAGLDAAALDRLQREVPEKKYRLALLRPTEDLLPEFAKGLKIRERKGAH